MDRLRQIMLVLAGLALVACALAPPALSAGGCGGPADSALNQYCETIPTGRGSEPPRAGTPSLAESLPPGLVRRIEHGAAGGGGRSSVHAAALRSLLSLPAAEPRVRPRVTPPGRNHIRQAATLVSSAFPLWLILVLAVTALGLLLAAPYRRMRKDEG